MVCATTGSAGETGAERRFQEVAALDAVVVGAGAEQAVAVVDEVFHGHPLGRY